MDSDLAKLEAELTALSHYLSSISAAEAALELDYALIRDEKARDTLLLLQELMRDTYRRQTEFNGILIKLSGVFEQFIESALSNTLKSISDSVPIYQDLPKAIVGSHIELSFDLIHRLEQSRFRSVTTVEAIVANLHSCMANGGSRYTLNEAAFVSHQANFRDKALSMYFGRVGLDDLLGKVRKRGTIRAFLADSGFSRDEFSILNELIDRRNEVAHGESTEILSHELLRTFVEYVRVLGQSLSDVIGGYRYHVISRHQGVSLGFPVRVFNSRIACFVSQPVAVSVGDLLIAQSPDGFCRAGAILSMQIKGRDFRTVQAIDADGVGLRVDFSVKSNQKFFLVPKHVNRLASVETSSNQSSSSAQEELPLEQISMDD